MEECVGSRRDAEESVPEHTPLEADAGGLQGASVQDKKKYRGEEIQDNIARVLDSTVAFQRHSLGDLGEAEDEDAGEDGGGEEDLGACEADAVRACEEKCAPGQNLRKETVAERLKAGGVLAGRPWRRRER